VRPREAGATRTRFRVGAASSEAAPPAVAPSAVAPSAVAPSAVARVTSQRLLRPLNKAQHLIPVSRVGWSKGTQNGSTTMLGRPSALVPGDLSCRVVDGDIRSGDRPLPL